MDLQALTTWILPILIAVTFHEAAHGWVAWRLGDDTAWQAGRVSFNPLRHVDPLGTIVLPGLLLLTGAPFLFGWAKPVPVAFWRLGSPRRDMALVAAAGPGINLLLASVAMAALAPFAEMNADDASTFVVWLAVNLANAVQINVMLAVFNLVPVPPLDGGRILVGLLPLPAARAVARLEKYGMLIILALFFFIPYVARELHLPGGNFANRLLRGAADFILSGLAALFAPA